MFQRDLSLSIKRHPDFPEVCDIVRGGEGGKGGGGKKECCKLEREREEGEEGREHNLPL